MRKLLLFTLSFMALPGLTQERLYDFVIFSNSRMDGDYFFSRLTEMDMAGRTTISKLPVSDSVFHTPGNGLKLSFTNNKSGKWQATIFRQELRGQDHFKPFNVLSFWIYNPSPSTSGTDLPVVQLMKKDSSLSEKWKFNSKVARQWQRVTIPLNAFKDDRISDPHNVTGIVFSQNISDGKSHSIYIDDIELTTVSAEKGIAGVPVLSVLKGYGKHIDITWKAPTPGKIKYVKIYRSEDGKVFKPVGIQLPWINRFSDFTGKTGQSFYYKIAFLDNNYNESRLSAAAGAGTRFLSDEELMTMVQEACFRYYWEGAEKNSGLATENIPGRKNMIASGASGFGIMALIVGTERRFITRAESVDRFLKIVNFLEKAAVFHGAYAHFIDGPTGKAVPFFGKEDNGGDLVETSFLLQGLLAARAYFDANNEKEKTIREKITAIWKRVDWNWYRRSPDSKFLYWHWSPDQSWVINHKLIGWNETMVTYLLSIASPTYPVPAGLYYSGWANQDSTGQQYRAGWGQTQEGALYTNGNTYYGVRLDVGVSNGGPLFFTHYSYLGYDPRQLTDRYTNYFDNNQAIARINYLYCVDNPGKFKGYGDSCWGLTASDGPFNYSADEPVLRQDRGKIAPTGAISSFPYTPVESMKALKNYYYNYGKFLWGEYGFRDAFNLSSNWCSEIYMGLNQAPMVVMMENYRSGLIWKLFMSNTDIQNGLRKLALEK